MKKIFVTLTLFVSILAHADGSSIFDSKDLPGAAKGTALCQGTKLSALGNRVVEDGLAQFYADIVARAGDQSKTTDENYKYMLFRNLVGNGTDNIVMTRYIYPRANQAIGSKALQGQGLYGVNVASMAGNCNVYGCFKYKFMTVFAQRNCDKLHYRGLGEAPSDQFSGK